MLSASSSILFLSTGALSKDHEGETYFGDSPPYPGNGGTRVLHYADETAAATEAAALAAGMSLKHRTYHTGFSGAKLVASVADTSALSRPDLISSLASVLNAHKGRLYTGCDLNTSLEDMTALDVVSPFVLSSLGSRVDPNVATGYGVAGAIASLAVALFGGIAGRTVFVQGCGKVGSTVGRLLIAAGAKVVASDLVPGLVAKAVPGAVDVSHIPWMDVEADIFAPCAASGIITPSAASCMRVKSICGSANVPFTTEEALYISASRGVVFVPEAVSSAGAVLVDSIEFFDPTTFFSIIDPAPVYSFVRSLCENKCTQLLHEARLRKCLPAEALASVEESINQPPVGASYNRWRVSSTRLVDYVVVGAGVIGAACAAVLASEGSTVEIIEQDSVASTLGSSCGDSRMYRQMQSDAFFTRMQQAAMPMWKDLEESTGARLLSPHGLLFWGEATEETVEGSIPGAAATMRALGVPHIALSSDDMASRFAAMAPSPNDAGLLEPGGGSIAASAAVHAFLTQAMSAGATLSQRVRVEAVTLIRQAHGKRCNELVLSDGSLLRATKQVVYAAGAWTPELLKSVTGVNLDVEIHSATWGHYEVPDHLPDDAVPQWFAFRGATHTAAPELNGCHGLYYGFPPIPTPLGCGALTSRIAKVGVDFTPNDDRHRPASMNNFAYSPSVAVAADMDAFVAQHWPGLGARVDLQCSPYSMTPDGNFVLGAVPGIPGASCFCGGSGRAFKFAPLLGACLADVAAGRPMRFDLEGRFDPSRLSLGKF